MVDKNIAELPELAAVTDDTLIPVWQPGAADEAQKMKGRQFREFAEGAAERYVEDATEVAEKAEQALAALGNDAQIAKKAAAAAADSEAKAKLYADQTEAAAGGGVASFNGRGGHVMPQAGDYTAEMVGAVAYLDSSPGATLLEKVKNAYEGGYNAAVIGLWENAPLEDAEGIQWGYAEYRKHATGFITVTIRNDVVLEPTKRRTIYIADWTWCGDWHKTATTDTALMRDGSNGMTHALEISSASYNDQLKVKRPAQGDVVIGFYGPEQKGVFGFDNNGKLFVRFGGSTASADSKEVLHTGNKPIGTYTGNGSAAARTIATGGSGRWVAIDASVNGVVAIVSAYGGAVYKVGDTIGTLSPTQAYFRNGVLTIATSTAINTNGAPYAYQVL